MNTEVDPGSLAPNELQLGLDVRLRGKIIETRKGMTSVADLSNATGNDVDNAIHWMDESPTNNPHTRLWIVSQGCYGAAVGTGAQVSRIDTLESPAFQTYANFFSGASYTAPIAAFGDRLFIGTGGLLQEILQISPAYGVSISDIMPSPPQILIKNFTGHTIKCMRQFNGQLFIGLEDKSNPATSKIVAWDGLSFSDDKTAIDPPLAMGLWEDELVVGFGIDTAAIEVRKTDSTWTNVPLAGFQCAAQQNAIVEDHGKTFIASGAEEIYVYDGSALTVAASVTGADTADGYGVTSLCMYQDLLHYAWNEANPYPAHLGRRDRDCTITEWTDDYKDITGEVETFFGAGGIEAYRDQIFIGGLNTFVIATAAGDPTGTMVTPNNAPALGAFPIVQLYLFPNFSE